MLMFLFCLHTMLVKMIIASRLSGVFARSQCAKSHRAHVGWLCCVRCHFPKRVVLSGSRWQIMIFLNFFSFTLWASAIVLVRNPPHNYVNTAIRTDVVVRVYVCVCACKSVFARMYVYLCVPCVCMCAGCVLSSSCRFGLGMPSFQLLACIGKLSTVHWTKIRVHLYPHL